MHTDALAEPLPNALPEAAPPAAMSAAQPAATPADEAPAVIDDEPAAARPDDVPEKFWDAEAGAVRTAALLRSYRELEQRLGRSVQKPEDEDDVEGMARLLGLLGRPESPDDYAIEARHPLLEPDLELNRKLHEGGFTQRQAQLVYDLAAERLLPVLEEARAELEATRQIDRLQQHFGGAEAWRTTAGQIRAYAEANLPDEVHATLAGSYEGVLALHEMMRKAEPEIVGRAGSGRPAVSEDGLRELVRDPRYWRDRDPEIVQRVTDGYRSLYPG